MPFSNKNKKGRNYIVFFLIVLLPIFNISYAYAQKSDIQLSVDKSIKEAEYKGRIRQKAVYRKNENGIKCEEILLTNDKREIVGNSVIFGQRLKIYFNQMTGFVKTKGYAYPEFTMVYFNEGGDSVLSLDAMNGQYYYYNEESGIKDFGANLRIGTPVLSGNTYTLHGKVSDKYGSGEFEFDIKLKILPNPWITIKEEGIACKEVALMYVDDGKNVFIPNNKLSFYNDNYINIIDYDEGSDNTEEPVFDIKLELMNESTGEVVEDLLDKIYYDEIKNRKYIMLKVDPYKIANSTGNLCRAIIEDKAKNKKLTIYIEF